MQRFDISARPQLHHRGNSLNGSRGGSRYAVTTASTRARARSASPLNRLTANRNSRVHNHNAAAAAANITTSTAAATALALCRDPNLTLYNQRNLQRQFDRMGGPLIFTGAHIHHHDDHDDNGGAGEHDSHQQGLISTERLTAMASETNPNAELAASLFMPTPDGAHSTEMDRRMRRLHVMKVNQQSARPRMEGWMAKDALSSVASSKQQGGIGGGYSSSDRDDGNDLRRKAQRMPRLMLSKL